ncbi:unnamed protein product [Protopolystoma xenopodis]|uniref:Uncharacterized protein n=1 Tax=Protopolystoma xenopodis TaxID=117903 RepID=A0A448WIP1_9PLAT|nr:unnamed protein product [Protopolystoma xenopodis]
MFKAIEPEFNSDAGKSGEINANSGEPSRMADNFAADNASLNAPDAMRNVGVKWNAELATTESKVLPTIGMTSHIDEASFV